MTITVRDFHWDDDFDIVRTFLIETYNQTKTFQNWIPSMFENTKFGPGGTEYLDEEDEYIKIWEDDSKVVAVTIIKPARASTILIHPDYRNLEKTIVLWIEDLKIQTKSATDDKVVVGFLVPESDIVRAEMLEEMGYENQDVAEHNRIRPVDLAVPEYELPEGYRIRHANVVADFLKYKEVQGSVFGSMKNVLMSQLKRYSEAQFYNAELDLVAVAPDGTFAGFVTVRIDNVSRLAEIEPLGIHPDHRRLGLAHALMSEGLKRVEKYKPECMVILGAASTEAATKFYDSLGFSNEDVNLWKKYLEFDK
ncbi:MAG: GNAT family N-acetyltransferase [Candidatus Thorarchaeota archaeon]